MENTTAEPSEATASASAGVWRTSFPNWQALLTALLVCVVIPTSLIGLHIHENHRISPIDEAAHFDYVSRLANGSFPRLGQTLLPSTLHVVSCTGQIGQRPPQCPGSSNPDDYPGGGYQYEAQQPPTYYAATVPIRWVGNHLFGMSPLTAARAGGALWMSAGLLLLWMAGRLVGLSVLRIVPAILLLSCGPVAIYESAIVSNDAPSIFAGASIAFLGVLAWTRPGRWTAPVLAASAFLVTSLKLDDALAVLVVSGTFAILGWHCSRAAGAALVGPRVRDCARRWAPNGGALLLGAAVCIVAWTVVNHELNLIDPRTLPTFNVLRSTPVTVWLIARESLLMFNPLGGSYSVFRTDASGTILGTPLSYNLQQVTTTMLQYALLAAGAAVLFVRHRTWAHWMGLLSIVALYVGGIVLGIGLWRTYGTDPSISGRYGLAVAPLLALALVTTLRGRVAVLGVAGLSIVLVGLTYYYSLAA